MKKIIISALLILLLTSVVYAKEYRFKKSCNPEILAQELKEAGIDLLGEDQIGYLTTTENEVIINTFEDIDEEKLKKIIKDHKYKAPSELEKEKEKLEKEKREAIKAKIETKLKSLNFTEEEVSILMKAIFAK